jgi:two-component system chemotaxis response regulator CheB
VPVPERDVVVVAASAGGIEAFGQLLAGLPADYSGAIFVVVHLPEEAGGALASIFGRAGALPVSMAEHGESIEPGHVYVAPANQHLLVSGGQVLVRRGPRENGHRPAADPLFRSAAYYFGPRVVGVVLSGTLNDGTAGLQAVRTHGGVAVVQDPDDAAYGGMPRSALSQVGADHVVAAVEIGPLLARLGRERAPESAPPVDEQLRKEVALMERDDRVTQHHHLGRPSQWPCPDCDGVLWEVANEPVLRFRCRVGHAWTAESLRHAQGDGVETALWMGLRALEDKAALVERMASSAEGSGRPLSAGRFRSEAIELEQSIHVLRELLQSDAMLVVDHEGDDG